MQYLHSVARAFCTACFVAGIALYLVKGSSLRQCIKAVAGLYILVIVLRSAPTFPSSVSDTAVQTYGSFSFDAQRSIEEYETAILDQSRLSLEKTLEQQLLLKGIDASVQLTLQSGPQGITVQRVILSVENRSDREPAEQYLKNQLQAKEIMFSEKGS